MRLISGLLSFVDFPVDSLILFNDVFIFPNSTAFPRISFRNSSFFSGASSDLYFSNVLKILFNNISCSVFTVFILDSIVFSFVNIGDISIS